MEYNARKHNPEIRKIIGTFGIEVDYTYSDKRKAGRRISMTPRITTSYRKLTSDAAAALIEVIENYLFANNIHHITVKISDASLWYSGTAYQRVNLHVDPFHPSVFNPNGKFRPWYCTLPR